MYLLVCSCQSAVTALSAKWALAVRRCKQSPTLPHRSFPLSKCPVTVCGPKLAALVFQGALRAEVHHDSLAKYGIGSIGSINKQASKFACLTSHVKGKWSRPLHLCTISSCRLRKRQLYAGYASVSCTSTAVRSSSLLMS